MPPNSPRVQAIVNAHTNAKVRLFESGFYPCTGDLKDNPQQFVWRRAGMNGIRVLMSGVVKQLVTIERRDMPSGKDAWKTVWQGNFDAFSKAQDPECALPKPPAAIYTDTLNMLYRAGFVITSEQSVSERQTLVGQLPLGDKIRVHLRPKGFGVPQALLIVESRNPEKKGAEPPKDWVSLGAFKLDDFFNPKTADNAKTLLATILDEHKDSRPLSIDSYYQPMSRLLP